MVLPFNVLVLPHRKHHFRQGVTIGIDMFWPYEMLIKEILASFQYSETASQKSSIKATVLKVQAAILLAVWLFSQVFTTKLSMYTTYKTKTGQPAKQAM